MKIKPISPEECYDSVNDMSVIFDRINMVLMVSWTYYERQQGQCLTWSGSEYKDEVISDYTDAGWLVTFETDQREGNFFRFKPR